MEEETCAVRNQIWTGKAVTYRDPDVIPGGSIATGCEGCSRPACLFTLEVKKTKMLAKSRATSLLLPLAALAALPVLRSTQLAMALLSHSVVARCVAMGASVSMPAKNHARTISNAAARHALHPGVHPLCLQRGRCARGAAQTSSSLMYAPSSLRMSASRGMRLQSINALTLCTHDMAKACAFYSKIGLVQTYGGPQSPFSTFSAHAPVTKDNNVMHVNLFHSAAYEPPAPGEWNGWGRCVFFVEDVDALHASLAEQGVRAPAPTDAPWGERFFHVLDPDGHELSFATPDYQHPRWHPAPS